MHKQAEHYKKKFMKLTKTIILIDIAGTTEKKIIFNKIIKFIETSDSTLDIGCGGPENYFELKKISKKLKSIMV